MTFGARNIDRAPDVFTVKSMELVGIMKASKELIDYIKSRAEITAEYVEEYEPNGDDRFKHILYDGMNSAFREILGVIGE